MLMAVLLASTMTGLADHAGWTERALKALRPPPRLHLSAWADAHFVLSPESSAEPGRWHTLPYQRGIMDAITDPSVTRVSVMKSARVGYTKIVDATVGYYMAQDPCPIMVVQPTIEDAEGFSKEEIAPMLRDCPALSSLVAPSRTRNADNTILGKRFAGGSLTLVGANSPRGFRRVSRKVVIFDETDGYPPSAGVEGDPIELGIRRTEYYWDRKIIAGSTPTIAGVSRIEQMFFAGDQRRYYVPCPECQGFQVLQMSGFDWPKHRPSAAVYICVHCGAEIEHRSKRDIVHAGEWRPGPHAQFKEAPAPEPFRGHASFHIWAAYSFSPNASWGQLCEEFVAATRRGPEQLKTFVNTALGETWREKGEAPEWQRLYARREPYPIGTCPTGVLFLTCGVDVQKDRLVYEVVGWGRDKRSWSIDAGVLPGDTSDEGPKGPWPALEALLARTYPHAHGGDLSIAVMAVDSGYNTQTVYSWCRRHPMSRVLAVDGRGAWAKAMVGTPSPVDVVISGKKAKRGYKVWPVGVDLIKAELYGWLALPVPTDEDGGWAAVAPGFCHFPQHEEEYFRQLTGEQLVKHTNRAGFVTFGWERIPGRENHFLDARVYARSGAFVAGLDRFRESDWVRLENMIGSGPAPPPAVRPAEGPPLPAAPASPLAPPRPTPPKRDGWLSRGRSGFWRR